MPVSALSLDVLRPSADLMTSTSSPFSPRTSLRDPLQTALGVGWQGGPHASLSISHRPAKRYFSSEQSSPNSQYKTSAKIPTPKSAPNTSMFSLANFDPQALLKRVLSATWSITKIVLTFLVKLPMNMFFYLTHPKERREKIQEIKGHAQKEFDHYWTGSKLLVADVRTARDLVRRTLTGSTLTRRERKQLLRTVTDLFRLVPFSMFLIVPAAEFALPFALRIFPNMLPSTFQDSLKAEENMKRELQSRIAMASFFQETLGELAKEQKRIAAKRSVESPDNEIANKQEQSAASMLEFLDRARQGEMVPPDVIVQYAKYFQDDLTLDNMPRMQLVNMCRYMQLQPYGADSFLRFQLRHRIRQLKEDDQRIIWEGIDSLTKMELREACQERGMRSTGLSKEAYKKALQQWLDLSVHKNVPISLLIMSRTFFLQEERAPATGDEAANSVASLVDAISGMDKEVLNEVILEVATQEEKKSNPDIRKIKLEIVTQQNERIREEREAAEKKKKIPERTEPPPGEPLAAVELELSPEQAAKLAQVVGAHANAPDNFVLKTKDMSTPVEPTKKEVEEAVAHVEEEKDRELSPAEYDAISQMLSADPVSKEREELARIRSAMSEEEEEHEEEPSKSTGGEESGTAKVENAGKSTTESPAALGDKQASSTIERMEKTAAEEAKKSTVFSTDSEISPPIEIVVADGEVDDHEKDAEDPVVARLKKRLESMVDKIELQLSDAEAKIGNKLHILDKDADGVLSREEMAECLHLVLKREITLEEAMEIADEIDENKDGVFTVQELITWIETNKLVQLESEGRDADMDRMMESKEENSKDAEKVGSKLESEKATQ